LGTGFAPGLTTLTSSHFDFTDFGDAQRTRAPFEREAPRIAQSVGDDDGLLDGTFDVEADELAEQVRRVLGSVFDPVLDRRVETSVGAERELAAEVRVPSPLRLRNPQDHAARARIDQAPARAVLLHEDVVPRGGEGDVETPVLRVARVESDRVQALEASAYHAVTEVEERPICAVRLTKYTRPLRCTTWRLFGSLRGAVT
jgi:hypothetical protein